MWDVCGCVMVELFLVIKMSNSGFSTLPWSWSLSFASNRQSHLRAHSIFVVVGPCLGGGKPLPSPPQSLEHSGSVCLGDPVSNAFSGQWHSCLLPQGLSSHKPVGETFTQCLMAFSVNLTAKYFTGVFPSFLNHCQKNAELFWLPLWPLWFYV